jgi:hypothetical protein
VSGRVLVAAAAACGLWKRQDAWLGRLNSIMARWCGGLPIGCRSCSKIGGALPTGSAAMLAASAEDCIGPCTIK